MAPRIALLASPLLGPASWEPVHETLKSRGWDSVIAAHSGTAPSSAAVVIASFIEAIAPADEWILVPHSNAGLLAPAVARNRQVKAVVYVDARLPEPGAHPMSPPSSLEFLAQHVSGDGRLAAWNQWWSGGISRLFPTPESERRCTAEMRRLPIDYFKDSVDGTGWADVPSAYLAFGEVYAPERERARALGLTVATIVGAEHLHMLVDPAAVAGSIEQLVESLIGH
ncbi:MAG TPA: hypothetical protein VFH54_08345 [Mycobacteriales bacterium]|nr:hypothetical protein [Mycobacteriales bacterium]